jgi:hypothetical protein
MTARETLATNSSDQPISRLSHGIVLACLWLALFLVGVGLALPTLDSDWFNDDLHLVRAYTADEIAGAMTGNYHPAPELGTQGYRPLTTLYYHTVGALAGENTTIARLIQIAVLTLALTLFAGALMAVGVSLTAAAAACLITLTFRNTWWMLVWSTDGVRGFMLVWAAVALWAALIYARFANGHHHWGILALLAYTLAIFTREEAIVFALIIPIIILTTARTMDGAHHGRRAPWTARTMDGARSIC